MNNKVNYSKWVHKLQKQLKQTKSEVVELNNSLLLWIEKAMKNKQLADALQVECNMYKTSSDGFYRILGDKDKSTDTLLEMLSRLAIENADLKKQLLECSK